LKGVVNLPGLQFQFGSILIGKFYNI